MTETHLTDDTTITVPGYKWYGYNRGEVHRRANKGSGGVGIFVKEDLLLEYSCKIVDKCHDGILGILIENKESDYRCVIYSCYLSPETSSWGRDNISYFSHLLSQVYLYSDNVDAIIICGDLNARIGNLDDSVSSVDELPPRKNIDTVINQHGHALIEFLLESKFCVLNGRVSASTSNESYKDGYTCLTPRGMSVVDYIMVPHASIYDCSNFSVTSAIDYLNIHNLKHLLGAHCKTPDHALLQFELCTNANVNARPHNDHVYSHNYQQPTLIFDYKKPRPNYMSSEMCRQALVDVIDQILYNRERQNDIDEVYDRFCSIVYDEMIANIPHFDISKASRKRWKPKKGFWNDDLARLWNDMHEAEKTLRKSRNIHEKRINLRVFKYNQNRFDQKYRAEERKYKREQSERFDTFQTSDPSAFWNELNKLGPKTKRKIPIEVYNSRNEVVTDLPEVLNKWKTDFERLYNLDNQSGNSDSDTHIKFAITQYESNMLDPLFIENSALNGDFTLDEIRHVIDKSKNGKAAGIDKIPYEALKNDMVITVLQNLFQLCFDTGKVPSVWLKSILKPIEKAKDNDPKIPLNYRGISLICCCAKLYSSLLNNRITTYFDSINFISDEQNGFRKNRSCVDHIFTIDSVLRNTVRSGGSVFAAFIDFEKAFDGINREYLLYKIYNSGINGKLYWAIKSLYRNNEVCVKVNEYFTDWFNSSRGVRQGDTLSPMLFAVYIDDLARAIKSLNKGIKTDQDNISILLYADDIVILSDQEKNLQLLLNVLNEWSNKWKVFVNRIKSKIIHFRQTNVERSNYSFKVGNIDLEYTNIYKYLGTYLTEFLKFDNHVETLAASGSRALGSVISKLKMNNFMSYKTYTKLYESCVTPVLDYAAEVCGFKNYCKPNFVQNKAMRIFMGVHRFAPVAGLEGDMAWLSPQYRRWLIMLRFWNKLIEMDDRRIVKRIFNWSYTKALGGTQNWCEDILDIMIEMDCVSQYENKCQVNLEACKAKMQSKQKHSWKHVIETKPKLRFYKMFKDELDVESYLVMNLSSSERSILANIRLGILPLNVETGRFSNIQLENRICQTCNSNEIEDEIHFLFNCNLYETERNSFFESVCTKFPDFHYLEVNDQLKYLFSKVPRPLAKFIKKIWFIRKNVIYN